MRALIAVALLLAAAPAAAHRNPYPKRDRLTIEPGKLVLAIRLSLDETAAAAILDRVDRDGDGRVDEGERKAATRLLVAQARRPLAVQLDGAPVALTATAIATYGLDADDAGERHVGVDVVLEASLPHRPRLSLSITDRVDDRAAVPLALAIDAGFHTEPALPLDATGETGVLLAPDSPFVLELVAGAAGR